MTLDEERRDQWYEAAECLSGGDWRGGSDPAFRGGLGFAPRTWADYGGHVFARDPGDVAPVVQVVVAERVLWAGWDGRVARGVVAWPEGCRDVLPDVLER